MQQTLLEPSPAPVMEMKGATFPYYRRLFNNSLALLSGDTLALLAAIVLAGFLRYLLKDHHMPMSRSLWMIPTWWVGAAIFKLLPGWGNGPVDELRRIEILLLAVFGMAAAALFLSKSGFITSRIKFSLIYLLAVPLVPFTRMLVRKLLSSSGVWGVPTVVYGTDNTISHVVDVLSQERGLGYQPYGVFDEQSPVGTVIKGVPVLGGIEESTKAAPVAILGAPSIPRDRLAALLEGPLSHYRRVIIVPDLLDIPSLWVSARDFMGVLGLEVERNLLNPAARILKQLGDVTLVLLAAPLWLPLSAALSALIWLDDRCFPFYSQERVGLHGKTFRTWKFRSMVPNAEKVLEQEMLGNDRLREEWGYDYKLKNDPRVTRMGRFLRSTSLDELPQLINVLKGEMALVGPRPLPRYHYDPLPASVRRLRDSVRPGITGLWQVSGRSATGTAGMQRWDTYYVRNWSVWLDIVIIVRTSRAILKREGAY